MRAEGAVERYNSRAPGHHGAGGSVSPGVGLHMGEHRLILPSGRGLCYAELGAPDGFPVLYCHGFPGSRLEAEFADRGAASLGARLIAADRPGMGQSDPSPGRTILAWADDVRALADHLQLDRFSVLGVSAGAPYALACGFGLAPRIRSIAIVSGLGPPLALSEASPASSSRLGLRLVARFPLAATVFSYALGWIARHASPLMLGLLSAKASRLDRRALKVRSFRSILAASLREAFRNGPAGPATDLRLLSESWGFALGEIHLPVHLWHGAADRVVSSAVGRFLERSLPECRATYVPGHGHYSLVHDYAKDILSHLVT